MLTPFGYFDLIEVMPETGCPVCNLLVRDVKKLLNIILYEYVTEPQTHATFRASRGLCNVHGWQLTQNGNVMSIAVLYSAVLDEALRELNNTVKAPTKMRGLFNRNGQSEISTALDPNEDCPVCVKAGENEARYIEVFGDSLSDERFLSAFRESDGLCIEHFKQVINRRSTSELIEVQRDKWVRLHGEMAEFIRKYDPTKAESDVGTEGDSWLRAVRQMVGEKGVFGTRSSE